MRHLDSSAHDRAAHVVLLSSEHGACKTMTARFWPWLSGKSISNLLIPSLFARKRIGLSMQLFSPNQHFQTFKLFPARSDAVGTPAARSAGSAARPSSNRVRANMEQLKIFEELLPESQGLNLAVTALHVPHSLDSGSVLADGPLASHYGPQMYSASRASNV